MTLEEFRDEIATILEEDVRPILPPGLGHFHLTLIAHIHGNPDADVVLGTDDRLDEIVARWKADRSRS